MKFTQIFERCTSKPKTNVPRQGMRYLDHPQVTRHAVLRQWVQRPWPLPNDLHIQTWPVWSEDVSADQRWMFYVKAFESYCTTYRHTYRRITTPLCGW